MVPSSSEDVTPAMGGQPTRLSRNYQRKIILYVLIFKRRFIAEMFPQSQPSFCSPGLSFEWCSFGCSLFCRLFGNEYNGSAASMRYNSLFISLPFFTKQQRVTATFCILERKLTTTAKISFSNFDAVLHILFGIILTVIDKLNESRFSRDS